MLSYRDFLSRFNLQVTPKEFSVVIKAIPTGTLMLFRNRQMPSAILVSLPNSVDSPEGKICFSSHSQKNNNKKIRALFQRNIITTPYVTAYWNRLVNNIDWKKVWLLSHKFLIANKVREVSFKIIHKYYPANHYMQKFKKDINTHTHTHTVLFAIYTPKPFYICFGAVPLQRNYGQTSADLLLIISSKISFYSGKMLCLASIIILSRKKNVIS